MVEKNSWKMTFSFNTTSLCEHNVISVNFPFITKEIISNIILMAKYKCVTLHVASSPKFCAGAPKHFRK